MRTQTPSAELASRSERSRSERSRGQVLPLFALTLFLFMGLCAIVIDITWYWTNNLRVQRAADAAALAGAVLLPSDPSGAYARAFAEAARNGYSNGVGGVTVTPLVDPHNERRLNVTINAPVGTFFMKVAGVTSIPASRLAKAEFVLPVPMGSPQNYYGVGYFVGLTNSAATTTNWMTSGTACGGYGAPTCSWTTPGNANGTIDTNYAYSATTTGSAQQWEGFNFGLPASPIIEGIQVEIRAKVVGTDANVASCRLLVGLSGNNGTNFTTDVPQAINKTEATYTLGGASNLWGASSWSSSQLSTSEFRVKLTFDKPSCGTNLRAYVNTLRVRVTYHTQSLGQQAIDGPNGETLTAQNFWGAAQSQGAPNIQGDAYMTYYKNRTATPNDAFDPENYYNYSVYMPPGTSNGRLYVFDPGFCSVSTSSGTGDSWTVGAPNGNATAQPVSSYFDLFNDNGTPYTLIDDILVATSGTTFRRLNGQDTSLGGSNGSTDCTATSWHNDWWLFATGLTGGPEGTTYRLHTYSTDPTATSDQLNTTALNSFAFFADASGGTPKIYGNGAMEAFARIPGGTSTLFYLAQIGGVHAGKTVDIMLWDPGDTNQTATLRIMQPTTTGYTAATFDYVAVSGNSASSACGSLVGDNVTSVVTYSTSSRFNGCWLHMIISLPSTYADVTPPGETEPNWWKIQYTMGGAAGTFATDLTTWQVNIRGNPVHLVP